MIKEVLAVKVLNKRQLQAQILVQDAFSLMFYGYFPKFKADNNFHFSQSTVWTSMCTNLKTMHTFIFDEAALLFCAVQPSEHTMRITVKWRLTKTFQASFKNLLTWFSVKRRNKLTFLAPYSVNWLKHVILSVQSVNSILFYIIFTFWRHKFLFWLSSHSRLVRDKHPFYYHNL